MFAHFVVVLLATLLCLGLILYGFSAAARHRFWQDLMARPGGPMAFRFILQPVMAAIAAIRDGVKDARLRRSPYLWAVLFNPEARGSRVWEGMIATARIIFLGLVMDMIYQFIVLKTFYPGQAVVVALLLAFLPYMFFRGPVARLARWRGNDGSHHDVINDE